MISSPPLRRAIETIDHMFDKVARDLAASQRPAAIASVSIPRSGWPEPGPGDAKGVPPCAPSNYLTPSLAPVHCGRDDGHTVAVEAVSPGAEVMFLDRLSERAQIDHVLASARQGMSAVLVLQGEAGAGKTALLDYAIDRPGISTSSVSWGSNRRPSSASRRCTSFSCRTWDASTLFPRRCARHWRPRSASARGARRTGSW